MRVSRERSLQIRLLPLIGRLAVDLATRSLAFRLPPGLRRQKERWARRSFFLSKAERGELALTLPTGLVRRDDGIVEKHPDQEEIAGPRRSAFP